MTIDVLKIIGCVVAGYLLGCISPSYLLGKLTAGKDIRQHGSGSAGTTNTIRTLGLGMGLAVFVLDALKGAAAFLLGSLLAGTYAGGVICGVAAVIGHNFPVFMGFRGGKGIASSIGFFLAIHPPLGACVLAIGIITGVVTRRISVGSLLGIIISPILVAIFDPGNVWGLGSITFLALLGIIMHRKNIHRLFSGKESQLTFIKPKQSNRPDKQKVE